MSDLGIGPELLNRRAAIERVAAILGGTLVGGSALWAGCRAAPAKAPGLTPDVALLDEVAETILPATDTPGAKAAKVGAFMALMVADCYDDRDQRIFLDGIRGLDERCRATTGANFLAATPAQRTALLTALDQEAHEYTLKKREEEPAHYFRMIKELTLVGYFTSEIGATQALRWVPVPGRYDPCLELERGQRTWASPA
jgi:hypothetical protein